MFDKEFVDRAFSQNEMVTVTFIKRDGTKRRMHCTTNPRLIPEADQPHSQSATPSDTSKRVYEILSGGDGQWRAFRYDSIAALESHG